MVYSVTVTSINEALTMGLILYYITLIAMEKRRH